MRNVRKLNWMLGGAIALALGAAMPAMVHAARDEEYDRSIETKDAPRAVVDAVEHHANGDKISELDHVRRADGFEFYRAVIRIHEHTVRDLRVATDGQIIDQHDFNDSDNYRDKEHDFDPHYHR